MSSSLFTNLLTRHEVAQYAGVSAGTVDYWTRRGHLPAVRLGRAVRFEREAVEALMAKRESSPNGKLARTPQRKVYIELTEEQVALVAELLGAVK